MIDSRQRLHHGGRVTPPTLPDPRVVLDTPRRAHTLDDAYAYCRALCEAREENTPIASRFMAPAMRPHVRAIYAFFRVANDLADRPAPPSERLRDLDHWHEALHRAFHGDADHPIFIALAHTVRCCNLPVVPFERLLTAFRMDQKNSSYATFSELRCYFLHAAEPMGQLLLYAFGYRQAEHLCFAAEACAGLQLTNFLQGLDADFNGHRQRLYLPLEDLHHFGVSQDDLRRRAATPQLRDLMRFQVTRARSLLDRGRPLLRLVGEDLAFELLLTFNSAAAVLDKIAAVDGDVFAAPPVLRRRDRALVLARTLAQRWPPAARADDHGTKR